MPRVRVLLVCSVISLSWNSRAQEIDLPGIVAAPDRFDTAIVTVTGEYRGRNTFSDLQDPPPDRQSFVLKSGSAAIWIVVPSGQTAGVDLDDGNERDRLDTLQITGRVMRREGRIWIRARVVQLLASEPRPMLESPETQIEPPLDITFSTPVANESDVARTTRIRIQFSDDLLVDSAKGRIRITYPTDPAPGRAAVAFTMKWNVANRSLELAPSQPLEPGREVEVELMHGIRLVIGGKLKPWTLRFKTAGA